MQIFTLIPLETKLLILVLSAITFAVILLRFSLYKELKKINSRTSRLLLTNSEEGIQPPIIDRLKNRYKKAGQNLEQVNTIALIDSTYKEETISFVNFKIQYDQAEGITKVLPNLLIAFGLIGTFWGITNNLNNISAVVTTLNQGNTDITGLVQGLKKPLQDMGVAFSASLVGILLGSVVTMANTIWNTNIAKHQLTATLEDYLDNVYKITVEGNTRLDKAIDRMVHQQEEFLSRFHENVGRALELSFGKAANQISEECGRINKIAEYVYTNFSNAAGTISTGATTFQQAANSLDHQTKNLANSLGEFKNGVNIFGTTVAQLEKNNIVQNLDRILIEIKTTEQGFVKSTQSLLSTQQGFTQSSQSLQGYIEEIKSSNKETSQLAHQVYEGLKTSNNQMGVAASSIITGATNFERATASLINQTQIISESVPKFAEGASHL
jgi:methyl-accepting chemotaxis protein